MISRKLFLMVFIITRILLTVNTELHNISENHVTSQVRPDVKHFCLEIFYIKFAFQ